MIKTINTTYFPTSLKYASAVPVLLSIYLIFIGYYTFSLLLILVAVVVITTKYVTEIDLNRKVYRDYLYLLSFRLNEENGSFNKLDRIIIVKENHTLKAETRSRSRKLDWTAYTGTLLFDGNKTLDLLTRNDKAELLDGLAGFALFLDVGIEDRTTTRHYWVDFRKVANLPTSR